MSSFKETLQESEHRKSLLHGLLQDYAEDIARIKDLAVAENVDFELTITNTGTVRLSSREDIVNEENKKGVRTYEVVHGDGWNDESRREHFFED